MLYRPLIQFTKPRAVLFLLFPFFLGAQPEIGLHFMDGNIQSLATNPAFIPENRLIISLPNLRNHLEVDGPAFGDLFATNSRGETILDVDQLLEGLKPENLLWGQLDVETIGISVGTEKLNFTFQHAVRFGAYALYPDQLPRLLWEGNAQFIDQTIDLGHDLQLTGYNEFSLGAAFRFGPLGIGARGKYLNGIGDISVERQDVSLYTSPDIYQLTIQTDYLVNSSAFLEYEGFSDFRVEPDLSNTSLGDVLGRNSGWGLDLGATFDLGKLKLAASVIDLGQINWTFEARNYSSRGNFQYDGLDLSGAVTGDSISIADGLDTLEQLLEVTETSLDYSTSLPTRIYLSGRYQFSDTWSFGLLLYRGMYREEATYGLAASARARLHKWVQVGGVIGAYGNAGFLLGLNTSLQLGPVQVIASSDNIPGFFGSGDTQFTNLRLGMNLVF